MDDDSEDPVTASYDVYLTPSQQEHLYLLQYPTRLRNEPYANIKGTAPRALRLKPKTGHLELDIPLDPNSNFNKYAGLKWVDSLRTAKDTQNDSSTFGLAGGLGPPKGGPQAAARKLAARDKSGNGVEFDRETDIQNSLRSFHRAVNESQVMTSVTLGGHIAKHDGRVESGEDGKPHYFVGAFKGDQLHLTRVSGTAQMRPQFHHIDAETQRDKLLSSRAATSADPGAGAANGDVRALNQRLREAPSANPKGDLEAREAEMEKALQDAREEAWTDLRFVDEDDDEAYEIWDDKMFVGQTESADRLKSVMDNDQYLDAISAPGRGSPTRRRRRSSKKKDRADDVEGDDDVDGEGDE